MPYRFSLSPLTSIWGLLACLLAVGPGCPQPRDEPIPDGAVFPPKVDTEDRPRTGEGNSSQPTGRDLADAAPPGCQAGMRMCGGSCVAESVEMCGPQCVPCPARPNTEVACQAGACVYACKPGYGACDGSAPEQVGCMTELVSSDNCGVCGRSCTGTACNKGVCGPEPIELSLSPNLGKSRYSFDGTYLYYGDRAKSAVMRIAKTGGTATQVAVGGNYDLVTPVGGSLFWQASQASPAVHFILGVNSVGAEVRQIARGDYPILQIGAIQQQLYWVESYQLQDAMSTKHFFAVRMQSGDGTESMRVFSGEITEQFNLVADGESFFWTNLAPNYEIRRGDLASRKAVGIYSSPRVVSVVAVDEGYVYWVEWIPMALEVKRMLKSGQGEVELLGKSDLVIWPRSGVFVEDDLYIFSDDQAVLTVPRAGGHVRTVVERNPPSWSVSYGVDQTHVYWIDAQGNFWRTPR